jgi:hypothetical protein
LQARHGLLLLLAIAGAIPYGCDAVWSLAVGGGIQILNLAVLERSVRAVLTGQGGGVASLFLFARFLLVLLAVGLVLTRGGVAPVPFLLGLSALVPAAIWFGLDEAARRS